MGRRLKVHVHLDGEVYGPNRQPPPDVAARITNPDAWEDVQQPTTQASEPPKPTRPRRASGKA